MDQPGRLSEPGRAGNRLHPGLHAVEGDRGLNTAGSRAHARRELYETDVAVVAEPCRGRCRGRGPLGVAPLGDRGRLRAGGVLAGHAGGSGGGSGEPPDRGPMIDVLKPTEGATPTVPREVTIRFTPRSAPVDMATL